MTNSQTGTSNVITQGDNAQVCSKLPEKTFQLIYLDPPFNTGKTQQGRRSSSTGGLEAGPKYADTYADYESFLTPLLAQYRELLTDDGTIYVHLDYREVHYIKVAMDKLFGRQNFLNEIIWAYDYGGRAKNKWPSKHDTILVYAKNNKNYFFDNANVDREPYMAPGLVGPEKAAKGKLPTDVWWHTIVPTMGKERTGYPTQKPEGILRRIINASSKPDSLVLDPFCGSGTTAAVAYQLGRRYVTIDKNPEATKIAYQRLVSLGDTPILNIEKHDASVL